MGCYEHQSIPVAVCWNIYLVFIGDLATWIPNKSSPFSWPPDGFGTIEYILKPDQLLVVLIIYVFNDGSTLSASEFGVWWCPTNSLVCKNVTDGLGFDDADWKTDG
jgi:hypothetical protein